MNNNGQCGAAYHSMTAEQVAAALGTDVHSGLATREAEHRLEERGPNELPRSKREHLFKTLIRQFSDFMVVVLMVAAVISLLLGEWTDGCMILAIVLLNGVLGFVQEYKAERSLAALKELTRSEARVLRDGRVRVLPAADLVLGDVVLLESGSRVPADLRLLEVHELAADEALLTGESKPVAKTTEVVPEHADTAAKHCLCFSGTAITRGRGCGLVIATGADTETGRIAVLLNQEHDEATPLQRRLKSLGRYLVFGCLLVCATVTVCGFLAGGNLYTMILTGVSLAVASIPEGLPAIVTICLALGVWRLSRCRAIVRRLPAVETLGCTTCICCDKTGTLTENRMTVGALWLNGSWHQDVLEKNDIKEFRAARLVMANCHSLILGTDGPQGDPTETALFLAAPGEEQREHLEEIAFTSERRRMSVLVSAEDETFSLVKGAPDVIIRNCAAIFENGRENKLSPARVQTILDVAERMGAQGNRILALAYRRARNREQMETDLTLIGLAALADPVRPEAALALKRAREAGIRTLMVTGDHPQTAMAVAERLGLNSDGAVALTGAEFRDMNPRERREQLLSTAVCARFDPSDKLAIVQSLRQNGEIVAMTGDGVNDAPAILAADIGIAMGRRGTDVAKEASDLVLSDDHFATIVEAVYQGRGVYENIRKFIHYLLSSNIGEVLVMLAAVLMQLPLPLLPLQILWINLVTDGLPALAVGVEKPSPALMREAPRPVGESVFARGLGVKILVSGFAIGMVTLLVFMLSLYINSDLAIARTMAFCTLVWAQLFYAFACRSEHGTLFCRGLFSNRLLMAATLFSGAMQAAVVYVPFMQAVFMTRPLTITMWAVVAAAALVPTLLSGTIKIHEKKYLSEQEFQY